MEFRMLGPVTVTHGGVHVNPGPPKQQCVLASLALSAGRIVPTERLITNVWSLSPPDNARSIIYTYIARLRGLLRSSCGYDQPILKHTAIGYILDIEADHVDALRAKSIIAQAWATPDTTEKHGLLREALTLWTDSPLTGLTGLWAEASRTQLEQLYVSAQIECIDIEMRQRISARLLDELFTLLSTNPLTERFGQQLMLALHQSGRTAAALDVYHQVRRRLAEELGCDPSTELQRTLQQILQGQPELSAIA